MNLHARNEIYADSSISGAVVFAGFFYHDRKVDLSCYDEGNSFQYEVATKEKLSPLNTFMDVKDKQNVNILGLTPFAYTLFLQKVKFQLDFLLFGYPNQILT